MPPGHGFRSVRCSAICCSRLAARVAARAVRLASRAAASNRLVRERLKSGAYQPSSPSRQPCTMGSAILRQPSTVSRRLLADVRLQVWGHFQRTSLDFSSRALPPHVLRGHDLACSTHEA
eukprot:scaffold22678_cov65-Phaeocystis_antarctica.AAC.5